MKQIAPGETVKSPPVLAKKKWNATGLHLETGATYSIEAVDAKDWRDWWVGTDPRGHNKWWLRPFGRMKRCRKARWLALIGCIGRSEEHCFIIGDGIDEFSPKVSGELFCFANDAHGFYRNNHGTLVLHVKRLS
jgi:hypothetical protein